MSRKDEESLATMSGGVRAGAYIAYQTLASTFFGPPPSAMVGTSGATLTRLLLATPSTLRRPCLTCGSTVCTGMNMASTAPPITSVIAPADPR